MPNRRLPPLNSLRAFEAAARHQSLSRAAQELCVTHSAISRQVAKLEEFLNAKLFERKHQQVVLTKRGAAYAARLQVLFDQIQEATITHFDAQTELSLLRIGVLSTFAMRFLIPRLARFKQRHPEFTLQVESAHQPTDPNHPDIDVAIWLGTGEWPDVVAEHLFFEELIPVGSPALLAGHSIADADDLEPFLLLHAAPRPDDWQHWLTAAGATRVDGQRGLRLEYSGLVYQGAVDGLGLAMAQTMLVQDDITHQRLVPVLDRTLRTGRSYYVVHAKAKAGQPRIVAFVEWLKAEIAQTPAVVRS